MNTPYYIFLDDIRVPEDVTWVKMPKHEWLVVRNYNDFVQTVFSKGIPSFVAYDHDLADQHYQPIAALNQQNIDYSKYREKTGYECAKFLVDECMRKQVKHPRFVVHSMNPVGRKNIVSYINSYNNTFTL